MLIQFRIFVILLLFNLPGIVAAADVLTGIDVLVKHDFREVDRSRVCLITNNTGVAGDGRSTNRLLHEAPNVHLVRIFSPEHGIAGKLDVPTIGDSTETSTNLRVVSLYGESRRPTPEMLTDIDTLVFDIQDIGTRFYTYVSTMGYAMQVAAELKIRFVVLDRPNPINGIDVAGPVLDAGRQSFVGFHTIPVRHGMTVGELANLFKKELDLDIDLRVIRMQGWQRTDYFDATGLPWIDPSPNMRSLTAAILYPGIGLLETTNVSVGRGTETPFEIIGAPWLDAESFARKLNAKRLPGVLFEPVTFTPNASTFANEICHGARIKITDRDRFEPLKTGFTIANFLVSDYSNAWSIEPYLRLLGNVDTFEALRSGKDVANIMTVYRTDLDAFAARRAAVLMYH
jgi:uncharacterized protein YbbC (DUF1343 family)